MPCICPDTPGYSQFMGTAFGECGNSFADFIPTIFGLLSTCLWFFALTPQLVANYKNKKTDVLSPVFLGVWLAGDFLNLVSAVMTNARFTMIICAIYFALNDFALIGQMFYYSRIRPRSSTTTKAVVTLSGMILLSGGSLLAASLPDAAGHGPGARGLLENPVVDLNLCEPPSPTGAVYVIGCILAWTAGSLYFFSRIPQILHLHKIKRVEGLSFTMFAICIVANTFGGAQFIAAAIRDHAQIDMGDWCARTLPFVIGSMGTLIFDAIIITLFFRYGRGGVISETKETEMI